MLLLWTVRRWRYWWARYIMWGSLFCRCCYNSLVLWLFPCITFFIFQGIQKLLSSEHSFTRIFAVKSCGVRGNSGQFGFYEPESMDGSFQNDRRPLSRYRNSITGRLELVISCLVSHYFKVLSFYVAQNPEVRSWKFTHRKIKYFSCR